MQNIEAAKPLFFTTSEVAQMLRISRKTVYRLVKSGSLPAVRLGAYIRIPGGAVRDFLQRGQEQ